MEGNDPSPFKRARFDSFASLEETHRLLEYDLDLEGPENMNSSSAAASAALPAGPEQVSLEQPQDDDDDDDEDNHVNARPARTPGLLPRRNITALDYLIKAKYQHGMTTSQAQQEWKKLSRTEKHVFETLAKEDLERYQRELVALAKRALAASTAAQQINGQMYSDDDGGGGSA